MRLTVLLAVVCVAELCAAIRPDQQFNAFEHGQNDGKASVLASQQDPEAQATMFKLHDLNADGALDVTETLTMYQTIANTMNFPESADRDAIMQTVWSMVDTNHDQKITLAEYSTGVVNRELVRSVLKEAFKKREL